MISDEHSRHTAEGGRAGTTSSRANAKYLVLVAHDDAHRVQRLIVDQCAPAMAADPSVTGLRVNITDRTPQELPYTPPPGGEAPPYIAALQIEAAGPSALLPLEGLHADVHRYEITDTTVWDNSGPCPLGKRPGLRYYGLLFFQPDLSEVAIRRSWAHHINLARRVHTHAVEYHQLWVVKRLDSSSPAFGGMSTLYFANEHDATERFFDTPEGRVEVTHETQHFILGGPRLYASEWVVK